MGLCVSGLRLAFVGPTEVMMRRLRLFSIALGLLAFTVGLTDCRWIKMKLGIGTDISSPDEGTPEWVVQQALAAAAESDEEKGWDRFARLLHSEQRYANSLKQWRAFKFRDFRKRVQNYVKDAKGPTYTIMRWVEEGEKGDTLTIFVESNKTDMPTPCTVQIDDNLKGLWKITRCSL